MNIKLSERQLTQLLDQFCVQLGYCLPSEDRRQIVESAPTDVGALVDVICLAEGFNPPSNADIRHRRQMRDMIISVSQRSDF